MRKEIEINGKWYWKLEATDKNQAFNPPEPCYAWDCDFAKTKQNLFAIRSKDSNRPSFFTDLGTRWLHCALLSSEHEKKSRRCTAKELSKWVLDGNGFWLDRDGLARTLGDFNYAKPDDECGKIVISICTWDGEPMEPTAQNMGLPE